MEHALLTDILCIPQLARSPIHANADTEILSLSGGVSAFVFLALACVVAVMLTEQTHYNVAGCNRR